MCLLSHLTKPKRRPHYTWTPPAPVPPPCLLSVWLRLRQGLRPSGTMQDLSSCDRLTPPCGSCQTGGRTAVLLRAERYPTVRWTTFWVASSFWLVNNDAVNISLIISDQHLSVFRQHLSIFFGEICIQILCLFVVVAITTTGFFKLRYSQHITL